MFKVPVSAIVYVRVCIFHTVKIKKIERLKYLQ